MSDRADAQLSGIVSRTRIELCPIKIQEVSLVFERLVTKEGYKIDRK